MNMMHSEEEGLCQQRDTLSSIGVKGAKGYHTLTPQQYAATIRVVSIIHVLSLETKQELPSDNIMAERRRRQDLLC